MAIRMAPAQFGGLNSPPVRNFAVEASAEIAIGEVVQRDSTNPEQIEPHAGGATVTGILGVAMGLTSAAGTPIFDDKIPVALAVENIEFIGQILDTGGGNVIATVAGDATYLGNQYGIIKNSGVWYLDEDDTTHVVTEVMQELPELNAVLFRFLDSAITA